MTSFEHHDFSGGHLIHDGFLPQHPASMALSAPSGISLSLPTTTAYQHGHYSHSDYYIPRTLAPHPGFLPNFSQPEYNHGEDYMVSSHSNSTRGRSGSGASTATSIVSYTAASPRTAPTSPHLLSGMGTRYQTTHPGDSVMTDTMVSTFRTKVPFHQIKQEARSSHPNLGGSSVDVKPITDDRKFCTHQDCQDDDGKPKSFFSRKADVTRHYKSCHEITYLDCPKSKCDRKATQGFTRRDHLTEHLRGFHMEDLPKRQTIIKRAKKQTNTNISHESNTCSEGLTTTKSTVEIGHSRSRSSSFADQDLRQEQHSSSDEANNMDFRMDKEYQPTTNKHVASTKNGSKTKVGRCHPYTRRLSKTSPQQISPNVNLQKKAPQLSTSPEHPTSRMMHQPQTYQTLESNTDLYTNRHMISPTHAINPDMGPYFHVSSMPEPYHGLYSRAMSRYTMAPHHDPLNGFQYQPLED